MLNKKDNTEDFEKSMMEYLDKVLPTLNFARDILNEGHRATYSDDKGRIIREYPNGKKYIVKFDEETLKVISEEELKD